ncbi:MAG TPA: hypothetical protein VLC92_21660 [Rhodocyclaceae bacterium]|nr:hypothetical protein [Rhodocyclaceae bacterium]
MEQEITSLTARLLAHRWLPRNDVQVRRALVDETFRHELEQRLANVGLQLLDNPFAEHVAVGLKDDVLDSVFGGRDYQASTMGLTRDEIALLIVIWALIILPKRERQLGRRTREDDGQNDMFGQEKPIVHGEEVSGAVSEASLLADFGSQLGGKTKIRNFALGKLARLGFIERRGGYIFEGPLLDVLLDYRVLADRIINGTLADVLAAAGRQLPAQSDLDDELLEEEFGSDAESNE